MQFQYKNKMLLGFIGLCIAFNFNYSNAQPPKEETAYELGNVEKRSEKSHKKTDKVLKHNNKVLDKSNKKAEEDRKNKLSSKKKKEDQHRFNF